jgi:nucleoside-diphosphate-sugar epimerase
MRVWIIGCGYIGLPLGAELARQGHKVFGMRRNIDSAGALKQAGIQPVFADITRRSEIDRAPLPFDWVVHCVASGGGGAEDYRRVYLQGTRNVLARLACTPPAKFVYTSSTSVYGQSDGSRVDEESPTEPPAETARVLLETEEVLLESARQHGFPAVVLRLGAIYGPGRGHWFRQFLSGEARIEGGGERILNMIHRQDAVGCVQAALRNGRSGEIYNAVDDEPVSQLQFFKWLAAQLKRPMPPSVPDEPRRGNRGVTSKRVSNAKLKRELGYAFGYPTFREGYGNEIGRLSGERI